MDIGAGRFEIFPFRIECSFSQAPFIDAVAQVQMLRRQFPDWLRKVTCATPSLDCRSCREAKRCGYALLFSQPSQDDVSGIPFIEDAAMPFAIRPPLGQGKPPCFDVVLVGTAAGALPSVVETFVQIGLSGYGRERVAFKVASCSALDSEFRVRGSPTETGSASRLLSLSPLGMEDMVGNVTFSAMKSVTLLFETLPLLKPGSTWSVPAFSLLLRRLRDRIRVLGLSYCGGEPDLRLKGLVSESEPVKTTSKKDGNGRLSLTCTGPLRDFIPLIRMGSYLNVGRGCAFGQGWYRTL